VDRPASQLQAQPPAQPQPLPATPSQIGFVSSPAVPPPAAAAQPQTTPPRTLPIMEACPSALSPASPC
jgi:hypothetical protein